MTLLLQGAGKQALSAAPFSPSDIAGLQVWLKDSGLSGVDGDPITTWTNSGAAGNFTQATGSLKPTKKTAILNGKDVARFDGVDDELTGAMTGVFGSAATLFIVAVVNDTQYELYNTGSSNDYWRFSGDGHGYLSVFRTVRFEGHPPTMPSTGNHYFSVVSSGSTWQFYKDGVAQTAQSASFSGGTTHTLGAGGNAGPFAGDIAEVIAYDTELSAGNITSVHNYLTSRFGL